MVKEIIEKMVWVTVGLIAITGASLSSVCFYMGVMIAYGGLSK